jgi:2-polyprenyl-3-methyl-5-hydroxy-6-metoxy-1,4-benzoquinol methylase
MDSHVTKHSKITNGVAFHDALADCWSVGYGRGGFHRRILFFRTRLQKCVRKASRWLDAGCGSGVLSRELGRLDADVVAVDGSPKMIKAAKLETDISDGRISFKEIATIEDIGEPDGSFDGVLCSSVIEYIDYPNHALNEIFRVIIPGGIFLLSVPNIYSPIRIAQKVIRAIGSQFGKEYYPYLGVSKHDYSARSIYLVLEYAGFVVDRIDYFDPIFSGLLGHLRLGSLLLITAHRRD